MATDTQQTDTTLPFSPLIPIANQMQSLQNSTVPLNGSQAVQPVATQSVAPVSTEQPGTLRSDGSMPTTPATVLDTLPEQQGFGINKDTVSQLQAIARTSAMESQQHTAALAALDKLSSSGQTPVMQHVLSVMAALNGNFGPAQQIMEQKRKAAIGKSMFPVVAQVNRLKALGRYDEATQLAEDAATRVGPQAPEIVPILSKIAADISTKQIQLQQEKTLLGVLNDAVQKNDVNRKLVDSALKANKGGMVLGADHMGQLMAKLSPHIQVIDNQIIKTGLLTGETTSEPMKAYFDPASLKGTVPASVQGETRLTLDQITNVLRDGPPINGWTKEALQNVISKYQARQAQFEVGGQVPLTPEYNAALLRVPGMTPARIAARDITPDEAEAARLEQQNAGIVLAEAPVLAANRVDATKIATSGYTVLNVNPEHLAFGRRQGLMTVDEMRANPDLYAVPEKIASEKIEPALRASDGFNYLRRMYEAMATPSIDGTSGYSRWLSGARISLEKYLGISLTPDTPAETVMKLIVDRSVEDLEKTQTVNNEVVQRLKAQLIGAFADPDAAIRAVDVMQERVRSDLNRYMLRNGSDISQLSGITSGHDFRGKPQEAAIRRDTALIADQAAQRFNISPTFLKAILAQESDGGVFTTHRAGDGYGPMQITHNKVAGGQSTAERAAALLNVPVEKVLSDHATNIMAGAALLSQLLKRHNGNEWLAARDYNGSGSAAEAYASRVTGRKTSTAVEALAPIVTAPPASPVYKGRLKGIPRPTGATQ